MGSGRRLAGAIHRSFLESACRVVSRSAARWHLVVRARAVLAGGRILEGVARKTPCAVPTRVRVVAARASESRHTKNHHPEAHATRKDVAVSNQVPAKEGNSTDEITHCDTRPRLLYLSLT